MILVPAEFPESWWHRGVDSKVGEVFVKHLCIVQPRLAGMCARAQLYYDHLTSSTGTLVSSSSFETFRRDLLHGTNLTAPSASHGSRRSRPPSQVRLLPVDDAPSTPPLAPLPYIQRLASQVSGLVYLSPSRSGHPPSSPTLE